MSGVTGLAMQRSLTSARPSSRRLAQGGGGQQGLVDEVALGMAAAEALARQRAHGVDEVDGAVGVAAFR